MKKSLKLLTLTLLIGCGIMSQSSAQSEAATMSQNESIVREFIAAWSNLDPAELASYFTEDGTYHNIPSGATTGRDNIQQFIAGFSQTWESTDWEIISLVADGDMVIVERLDKTVVAGSPVDLPCVGIYEMENGKIKMWRDYFDLATYTNALTAALNQAPQ